MTVATFRMRALTILWTVLVAILALGHVTALRNLVVVVVILLSLSTLRRIDLRTLPARWWLLALVAWAGLSILWSPYATTSFGKWRTDLFLPVAAYVAAYAWVRQRGDAAPILRGVAAGILILTALSLFSLFPPFMLDQFIPEDRFETMDRMLPIWYPGVGDASMFAVLCTPLLLFISAANRLRAGVSTRVSVLWLTVAAATVAVVLLSRNRNAFVVVPVLVALFVLIFRSERTMRGKRAESLQFRKYVRAAAIVGVTVIVMGIGMEALSRARLESIDGIAPAWGSATLELMKDDPRPRMWARFIELGIQRPWFGTGFGRTVPAEVFEIRENAEFIGDSANGFTHAHNIFINLWLQIGLVGVLFWTGALLEIMRISLQRSTYSSRAKLCHASIVALMVGMLLRDFTDDFMVYAIATAFWIFLGALLGLQTLDPAPDDRPAIRPSSA